MTAELRRLWRQAFGDTEETLDAFFATGFSPARFHCILEDNRPVSALYWFDCALEGRRLAYLYAVATEQACRGRGLFHRLMADTHARLKDMGYAGAILVPGSQSLFSLYETLGYRTVCSISPFSCAWGDSPVCLEQVDAAQYAHLRKGYLPAGGVIQEGAALDFLQTQAQFYAGADFLLAASVGEDTLLAQEFLGNPQAIPGILRALHIPQGQFRMPGEDTPFAMFLPFEDSCPTPTYFGLALD